MNSVLISLRLLTSGIKEFELAGNKASVIMTDAKIYATQNPAVKTRCTFNNKVNPQKQNVPLNIVNWDTLAPLAESPKSDTG